MKNPKSDYWQVTAKLVFGKWENFIVLKGYPPTVSYTLRKTRSYKNFLFFN